MTRYVSLITFTEEGIRNIKNSIERATAFRLAVESAGGKVYDQYWSTGEFDGCVIFEAPNDQIATALLLKLGHDGHVRTRTLQVYNASEFQKVLASV